MQAKVSVEIRRGLPKEAAGTLAYRSLDDEAKRAREHLELGDLGVDEVPKNSFAKDVPWPASAGPQ